MKYIVLSTATRGNFEDICCAVTYNSEGKKYRYWYTKTSPDDIISVPSEEMAEEDKVKLAEYLTEQVHGQGSQLFGWATQAYHLHLLYNETGLEFVKRVAADHIDLQFDLLDNTGVLYPLAGVARWLGMAYDPDLSKQVPDLWNSGRVDNMRRVLQHVKTGVDVVIKLIETIYPKEGENQLPLSVGFVDSMGKQLTLPTNGLPVSYAAMAYRGVKKHALQTPYVKALDWLDVWN